MGFALTMAAGLSAVWLLPPLAAFGERARSPHRGPEAHYGATRGIEARSASSAGRLRAAAAAAAAGCQAELSRLARTLLALLACLPRRGTAR